MHHSGEPPIAIDEVPLIASPALRLAAYLGSIVVLLAAILITPDWLAIAAALPLGIVYAHGLELQHEALHGLLLSTERGNRLAGSLLGLPMLTTFTDTRIRHLHHHRFAGTAQDLFDRSCADFASLRATLAHVFSVRRLFDFITMTFAFMCGHPNALFVGRAHARAKSEFVGTAVVLMVLLSLAAMVDAHLVVWGWVVPALVVAPPVHFLMTSAEHLGRSRLSPRAEDHARSYHAPMWWNYLVNYDNYHIEHHLRPALPFHHLPALHADRCRRDGVAPLGYLQAINDVVRAVGDCLGLPTTKARPPCAG